MIIIHAMKTLPRLVGVALRERLRVMPAVVVTGARQTGKSTLAEQLVQGRRLYRSLDDLDVLDAARRDPDVLVGSWQDCVPPCRAWSSGSLRREGRGRAMASTPRAVSEVGPFARGDFPGQQRAYGFVFAERYRHGPSTLRYVKGAPREIVRLLTRPTEGRDFALLRHVFSLDVPTEESVRRREPRTERAGLDGSGETPGIATARSAHSRWTARRLRLQSRARRTCAGARTKWW